MSASTKRKVGKRKRMDWLCGPCDYPCATKDELVAHCQREHQDDGYLCWDQAGTLGSKFSDSAMETMRGKLVERQREFETAQAKAEAYDKLIVRWNALCRALHIGQQAMDAFHDAYPAPEKSK